MLDADNDRNARNGRATEIRRRRNKGGGFVLRKNRDLNGATFIERASATVSSVGTVIPALGVR